MRQGAGRNKRGSSAQRHVSVFPTRPLQPNSRIIRPAQLRLLSRKRRAGPTNTRPEQLLPPILEPSKGHYGRPSDQPSTPAPKPRRHRPIPTGPLGAPDTRHDAGLLLATRDQPRPRSVRGSVHEMPALPDPPTSGHDRSP